MKRKFISIILVFFISFTLMPKAAAAGFPDVPQGSWAAAYISKAVELGVVGGYDDGRFGYGDSVTRAQFAAMLVRLFHWGRVNPDTPTFQDNSDKNAWFYGDIETAVINGAVAAGSASFRPNDVITRAEMAVMLVRGLGYETLAGTLRNVTLPFTDVTDSRAYIEMAYDFGIITGTTETTFSPTNGATREQAAAMMIRLYDRFFSRIAWAHAFYAVRAYAQKDLIDDFNAVSFGWSRLELDGSGKPVLNTSSSNGNSYSVPDGYQEVIQLAKGNNVKAHLSVYMSTAQPAVLPDGSVSDACSAILTNPVNRKQAVAQIAEELRRENSYTGVTIDFEEMWGSDLKTGFNAFLQELKAQLGTTGMGIYVCVAPVMSDGHYYDGYDYRTIASLCDKVILMAHDYTATALTVSDMNANFTETPVSPIYEVYTALRAACDPLTGVEDRSKLALAVSFNSVQWKSAGGKVTNQTPFRPEPSAINNRMLDQAAAMNYSEKYQNAYITYQNTEDKTDNIIWYEDARSVGAKMDLARMFGVNGISFWRLGLVPAYPDPPGRQLYFDIPAWLTRQK